MVVNLNGFTVNTDKLTINTGYRVLDMGEGCRIHDTYQTLATFEYISSTYDNCEKDLWDIAVETRRVFMKCDDGLTENEAIEIACENLGIELIESVD